MSPQNRGRVGKTRQTRGPSAVVVPSDRGRGVGPRVPAERRATTAKTTPAAQNRGQDGRSPSAPPEGQQLAGAWLLVRLPVVGVQGVRRKLSPAGPETPQPRGPRDGRRPTPLPSRRSVTESRTPGVAERVPVKDSRPGPGRPVARRQRVAGTRRRRRRPDAVGARFPGRRGQQTPASCSPGARGSGGFRGSGRPVLSWLASRRTPESAPNPPRVRLSGQVSGTPNVRGERRETPGSSSSSPLKEPGAPGCAGGARRNVCRSGDRDGWRARRGAPRGCGAPIPRADHAPELGATGATGATRSLGSSPRPAWRPVSPTPIRVRSRRPS